MELRSGQGKRHTKGWCQGRDVRWGTLRVGVRGGRGSDALPEHEQDEGGIAHQDGHEPLHLRTLRPQLRLQWNR